MNRNQAIETAKVFETIGGFSKVEVDHRGFFDKLTPEIENDGNWVVWLWSVNAKAGNRNTERVDDQPATEKEYKLIAKNAKGKANERDREALNRIKAERELD